MKTWDKTANPNAVIGASVQERLAFIRRTYSHLGGAIAAFVLLEVVLFKTGMAESIFEFVMGTSWLLFIGAFMVAGFIASRFARSDASPGAQYFGLGLYVVAQALIFVPILYMASDYAGDSSVIPSAAVVTLLVFFGLTVAVFATGKDFSFMRTGLMVGGFLAFGAIVCGILFGFSLGIWFSVGMAGFAAAFILYDTSNVLHHYRTNQHVAASLALFSSVALLFWYVIRIFMSRD